MFNLVFMRCDVRLNSNVLFSFSKKLYKFRSSLSTFVFNKLNSGSQVESVAPFFSQVWRDTVCTFNHRSYHTGRSHRDHPSLPCRPSSLENSALYKRLQRKRSRWKLSMSAASVIRSGTIPKTKIKSSFCTKPSESFTFCRLLFFLLLPGSGRGSGRWGIIQIVLVFSSVKTQLTASPRFVLEVREDAQYHHLHYHHHHWTPQTFQMCSCHHHHHPHHIRLYLLEHCAALWSWKGQDLDGFRRLCCFCVKSWQLSVILPALWWYDAVVWVALLLCLAWFTSILFLSLLIRLLL